MKKATPFFLFAAVLIIIDQVIKLWMHYIVVPQHFGQIELIPNVFKLQYVLNNGMAFGMQLDFKHGKVLLSIFRVLATVGIAWYLYYMANNSKQTSSIWAIGAILAGALGNGIDGAVYGKFLDGNMPFNAPYPWFHGQVIDMFYCNFLDGYWPEWVPKVGGTYHSTPIFNFADACIFCGVVVLVFFHKTEEKNRNFVEEAKTIIEPEKDTAISSENSEEDSPLETNQNQNPQP
jgi:signal peptidase II